MSPLDSAFLDAEDDDRHASLAIASVAVFEGPAPAYEELVNGLASRLPLVPKYRKKVRQIPFDLGPPVWVDDPHFDIAYHVRHTALPPPGGATEMQVLMGRVMSQRLDRDRPLWEYWMVDGLEDGRWALISKVHHCMVDGVSGTNLYEVLLDRTPVPAPPPTDTWSPAPEPSTLRLTASALADLARNPVEQLRLLGTALRRPREVAQRAADTIRGVAELGMGMIPVGRTSLSGHMGQQRRYVMAAFSLDDARMVHRVFGCTINDVALSAVAGGFRRVLLARDEEPKAHLVRTLVPVSMRAPGEEGICENRVSCILAFLPVDVEDPVERLAAVHERLYTLKSLHEAQAGDALMTLARHEPFPPIAAGIRLGLRLNLRSIITVTTNVPGPRQPLYGLGRRVVEIYPYVPIATTLRFGIAIFSYCDRLTFGVTGDYEGAPDVDVLVEGIRADLQEVVSAARRAAGATGSNGHRRVRKIAVPGHAMSPPR